jgi:hypothetical protein
VKHMKDSNRNRWGIAPAVPNWLVGSLLALILVLSAHLSPCLAAAAFEKPRSLPAKEVLPAALLKDPAFVVDKKVVNDGFFNTYQCVSPHGKFQAVSGLALAKLIKELRVIDAMAKLETTSAFGNAIEAGIKKTGKGLEALVTDPVGTVTATVEQTADKVVGIFNWASKKLSPDEGKSDPASAAEDSKVEQLAGLTKAKREIAAKFGVDVYSANKVLQHHLERIAWASIAGGMGLGKAMGQLPAPAKLALSASSGASKLENEIATSSAGELREKGRKALEKQKLKPGSIDRFMANVHYSPREQAEFVASVCSMPKARDRHLLLDMGAWAPNRETAFVLTEIAKMYAGYNQKVAKLDGVFPVGRVVFMRNTAGAAIVAIPADYVIWSQKMAKAVEQVEAQTAKWGKKAGVELWLTGKLSRACAAQLEKRGWKVKAEAEKPLGLISGSGAGSR